MTVWSTDWVPEFKDNQGYEEKPHLEKSKQTYEQEQQKELSSISQLGIPNMYLAELWVLGLLRKLSSQKFAFCFQFVH